jgi:sterol desaturase/sphingolipid hydroxylase (fatty acid hydroxylase superfamily)
VFPGLLAGAIALLWHLQTAGVDLLLATTLVWTVAIVVLVGLERLLPFERAWQLPDDQLVNDFAHTFLGSAVGSRMGAVVADVVAAGLLFGLASLGLGVSPGGGVSPFKLWPFWVQVVVAYVVVDFCRYWQHRVQHRVGFLWETTSCTMTLAVSSRSRPGGRMCSIAPCRRCASSPSSSLGPRLRSCSGAWGSTA